MPHVYINEKDSTVAGSIEENTNVVYIPGLKAADGSIEVNKPTLFKTSRAFQEAVGSYDKRNWNSRMAEMYIFLGLTVLFEAVGSESESGFLKENLSSGEVEFDFDKVALAVNWDKLRDRGLYKVKFLTAGAAGNALDETVGYAEDMLKCAAARGDCIALIDHKAAYELATGNDGDITADDYAQAIHEDFESIATKENNDFAKFGAAFSPWCNCTLGVKEQPVLLPASFVYLSAYGKATQNKQNPNWFAYAGSMRGIPAFKVEPLYKFGDVANAILQGRDIDWDKGGAFVEDDNQNSFAINPISDIDPFGNIVWGNRTLLFNEEGLTASSFLNVRNLVCDIKKRMYKTSRKFTFEQNDDILWANFSSDINELLDRAKSGRGIRGSKLEPIETDIKGRLKAHLVIIPVEAAEDFDLTLEMADSLDIIIENA